MKFAIRKNHFNALHTVAPTNEVRYYLMGFHVDLATKVAVATDGHRLVTVPVEVLEDGPEGLPTFLFAFPHKMRKMGKAVERVVIDTEARTITGETFRESGRRTEALVDIDGKFPDWQKLFDDLGTKLVKVDEYTFNPALLADIGAALESDGCTLQLTNGNTGATNVIWIGEPDVRCLVMPRRK